MVAVTTKWPWMNDYLKNVHSGRQANECYIIFFSFVCLRQLMSGFFFIIKNIYNLPSLGTDLMLGTRSLTWLYTNRILYARHKFLYAGLSVSQLKFFSHYSTQHNFFSLWFPQFPVLSPEHIHKSLPPYPTLYYFSLSSSCLSPLLLKPCYSLHVRTWNLRVWESNRQQQWCQELGRLPSCSPGPIWRPTTCRD